MGSDLNRDDLVLPTKTTDSKNDDMDLLKQAFLEGYKEGRNVESISDVTRKTAKQRYERWKEINNIGDEDE